MHNSQFVCRSRLLFGDVLVAVAVVFFTDPFLKHVRLKRQARFVWLLLNSCARRTPPLVTSIKKFAANVFLRSRKTAIGRTSRLPFYSAAFFDFKSLIRIFKMTISYLVWNIA